MRRGCINLTACLAWIIAMILAFFLQSPEAFAARIIKVNGKQVLIDNEDTELAVGDKFFVIIDDKKKGLVQITKIQGKKALARISKGKAEVDATLEPVGKKKAGDEEVIGKKGKKRKNGDDGLPGLVVGVIAGYGMDSQTVTTSGTTASMTGSGYSVKGYGDMPISGSMSFVGRAGLETLNLAGGTVAATGEAGKTSIMYLTVDGLVKYAFSDGDFQPYVSGGMGLHVPMSNSSNVLVNISSTSVFFGNVGANFRSGDMFYTALFEYGLFPPSQTVSTSIMALRAGAGWHW